MTNPPQGTPGTTVAFSQPCSSEMASCSIRLAHARATLNNIKTLIETLQDQLDDIEFSQCDDADSE